MEKKKDLLETLIQRAEQSKSDTLKVFAVKSDTLGKVEVRVPEVKKLFELVDDSKGATTMMDEMLADAEIVYESIPCLKENFKELSEAYDEKDPAELTFKIFNAASALGEMNDISAKVIETAGLAKRVVKN